MKKSSMYRIKQLFYADWVVNKKAILLSLLFLFLLSLGLLLLSSHITWIIIVYVLGSVCSLFLFCLYMGKSIHENSVLFLCTPASISEKCITFIFEFIICFVGFHLILWFCFILKKMIFTSLSMIAYLDFLEMIYSYKAYVIDAFVISSFLLFCQISFKKFALLKGLAIIFIVQSLLFGAIAFYIAHNNIKISNIHIYDMDILLAKIHNPLCLMIITIFILISFIKLKKVELK